MSLGLVDLRAPKGAPKATLDKISADGDAFVLIRGNCTPMDPRIAGLHAEDFLGAFSGKRCLFLGGHTAPEMARAVAWGGAPSVGFISSLVVPADGDPIVDLTRATIANLSPKCTAVALRDALQGALFTWALREFESGRLLPAAALNRLRLAARAYDGRGSGES